MTVEELIDLLEGMPAEYEVWIDNEGLSPDRECGEPEIVEDGNGDLFVKL